MIQAKVVLAVLFWVVLVFNVTGNSLVIHIIWRKQRSATDYLLLNLAVADLTFGVAFAPGFFAMAFENHLDALFKNNIFHISIIASTSIAWIASLSSIFTMMTLSLERYFAVCRPHSFKRSFSKRNVKIIIMISWLFSVIFSSRCTQVLYKLPRFTQC